jgi:hypothetical protein
MPAEAATNPGEKTGRRQEPRIRTPAPSDSAAFATRRYRCRFLQCNVPPGGGQELGEGTDAMIKTPFISI